MPIRIRRTPLHWMRETNSFNTMIEAMIAVGSSAPPSIVASPEPVLGEPIANAMIGMAAPNKPNKIPYFHRPSDIEPLNKNEGEKQMINNKIAPVVIKSPRFKKGTSVASLPLLKINNEKVNADNKPKMTPLKSSSA